MVDLLDGLEAWYEAALRGKPCHVCGGLEDDSSMVLCDRCEQPHHPECGADGGRNPVHEGPWYCTQCRGHIHTHGYVDVIQDLGLIDFLWLQKLPDDEHEADRVRRVAARYRASGKELQTEVNVCASPILKRWVNVPPVPMRAAIVQQYHEVLGHAGRDRTVEALLYNWWWPGVRDTVAASVRECTVCQRDRVAEEGPKAPPQTAFRPDGPFQGWSVDLAGPFPADADGNRWAAVAVDVYTKWVEIALLPSKHAFVTARWFYTDIICRWGRPAFVRSDNGTEWMAEFSQVLARLGIVRRTITVGNKRCNGQAEVYIRCTKNAIRKHLTEFPTSFWSDGVPYALQGLRMAPTRAHGFPPFTVVTGAVPVLPCMLPDPDVGLPVDPTPAEEESFVVALLAHMREVRYAVA